MRAVVQRVSEASVRVGDDIIAHIGAGLLVYLGVENDDTESDVRFLADKTRFLRIFPDDRKPMNRDVIEVGGAVLVVSAFTTMGNARRGRRPSFERAASGDKAARWYERFCDAVAEHGLEVQRGRFGTHMDVGAKNDGPVCILLDSRRTF